MRNKATFQHYLLHLLSAVWLLYKRSSGMQNWREFLLTRLEVLPFLESDIPELLELSKAYARDPKADKFKNEALQAIFTHLSGGNQLVNRDYEPFYFLPGSLSFAGAASRTSLFPRSQPDSTEMREAYESLWASLQEQLELLQGAKSYESYCHGLFMLLSLYMARMPGTKSAEKDVSLFDEIKSEACQMACQQHAHFQAQAERPFMLIKGDLSGIQKFIYSEIDMSEAGNTAGLSRKLRGRSFYIALLTDFIADLFVEKLGLISASVLYQGGGHFLLVAPASPSLRQEIQQVLKAVNLFLFYLLSGRVELVVGMADCGKDLFQQASTYYPLVSEDLGKGKYQKHHAYLEEIFYPRQSIKPSTIQFRDDWKIGQHLPRTENIVELRTRQAIAREESDRHVCVAAFEVAESRRYFFMPKTKTVPVEGSPPLSNSPQTALDAIDEILQQHQAYDIQEVVIHRLNHSDFLGIASQLHSRHPGLSIRYSYFLIGTYAPQQGEEVMEFTELARQNSVDSPRRLLTFEQLGVMRLDVDDLGSLFASGLGSHTSFARVATLSRELSLFFSGYINRLAEKWQIYVTYSGGDDAFVVGSWLNVLHFARELQAEFKTFVCDNERVSFSAGVFLCGAHFPVAKFAQRAEEAEKQAKQFIDAADPAMTKNAICVFDQCISWRHYPEMIEFASALLKCIPDTESPDQRYHISRSLVHRILRLIRDSIDENGQLHPHRLYRNATRLHYLMAKQGFDDQAIEARQEELTSRIIRSFIDQFSERETRNNMIANYLIPTSYVLLKTRK